MRRVQSFSPHSTLTALTVQADQNTVRRTFNVGNGRNASCRRRCRRRPCHERFGGVVTIEVTRRGNSEDVRADHLTFDQSGSDVTVRSRGEHESSWFRWSRSLNVHYEIKIPSRYNIDVKTSGGNITGSDIGGNATYTPPAAT